MKVTIKDIAKKADVSPSTVSRVLNKKGRISEKTRKKVLKIAKEMGYSEKVFQNSNKEGYGYIAIAFENRMENIRSNDFYGEIINGVEEVLKEYGYQLVFKTITGNSEEDHQTVDSLIKNEQIKGAILTGYGIPANLIKKIKNSRLPVVLIDNDLWQENIDCVMADNMFGARKIVNNLIKSGHRKIGFLGGPLSHVSLNERYIGYKQALKKVGIKKEGNLIKFSKPMFDIEEGYKVTKKWLQDLTQEEVPSAIFCAIDRLAIGAIKAIGELGYTVPDDISIVGFDDVEMSKHISPPLTTVRIFKKEMGIEGAKRLMDLINGVAPKPLKVVVSVEPVFRESTINIEKETINE